MQTTHIINSLDRTRILESFTPVPGRLNRMANQIAYGASPMHIQRLIARLQAAEPVIPTLVPKDMVTMNSIFRLQDRQTLERRTCALVYPDCDTVDTPEGVECIEIHSELGSELIGRRVGEVVHLTNRGAAIELRITAIEYQPESAGDFDR